MNYTQTGTYLALLGIVGFGLTKLGIAVDPAAITAAVNNVLNIIQDVGALVAFYGVVHQAVIHRNFAQAVAARGIYVRGIK